VYSLYICSLHVMLCHASNFCFRNTTRSDFKFYADRLVSGCRLYLLCSKNGKQLDSRTIVDCERYLLGILI
jgi:hypothetical protein